MKLKNHLIGFSFGYFVCMLIVFFVADYFSWGFALGSFAGIGLFALLMRWFTK
ncbi:Uncharacterised protein [Bacillus freudenreichii]|nr:Uncharacterised protein [Bacillus freudenreichii]